MRARHRIVALIALLAAAGPGSAQQGSPVHLRLRLQPGQTFRVLSSTEMDNSQTMMGQEQQSRQINEFVILNEVLSVGADGVARVRGTYESARVVMDGPMGLLEYDSTDPESTAPQALRPFTFMVGESFTMDLSPDGSTGRVEGLEDLMTQVLEEMDIPPGPMREQFEESLEGQFGPQAVEDMMEDAMPALPDEPVSVGDTWTRSSQMVRPMPRAAETTWTLRERRGGVAYLDVHIVMVSEGSVDMGPAVMTTDLSGEMTGTAEVDEATGLTLRSRMEGEMSGTVTLGGGAMGDISMPMSSRTVITTELLPGN